MSPKPSGAAVLVLALLLAACASAAPPPGTPNPYGVTVGGAFGARNGDGAPVDAQGIPLPGPGRGAY
jgi:hypothetical protein